MKISRSEGKAEGLAEGKAEVVRKMLNDGYTPDDIEKITGISVSGLHEI